MNYADLIDYIRCHGIETPVPIVLNTHPSLDGTRLLKSLGYVEEGMEKGDDMGLVVMSKFISASA